MTLATALQDFGTGTQYVGYASLGVMACVGVFAIDIVMMAALQKQAKEGKFIDLAFTMMAWHYISGDKNANPLFLLIASPVTTIIAIALSIAYEVPSVGLFLAAGWAVAASLVVLGWAIKETGKCLEHGFFATSANKSDDFLHVAHVEAVEYYVEATAPTC